MVVGYDGACEKPPLVFVELDLIDPATTWSQYEPILAVERGGDLIRLGDDRPLESGERDSRVDGVGRRAWVERRKQVAIVRAHPDESPGNSHECRTPDTVEKDAPMEFTLSLLILIPLGLAAAAVYAFGVRPAWRRTVARCADLDREDAQDRAGREAAERELKGDA